MGYVYILQSQKNGRYYIGSSNDCERRFKEHQEGRVKSTQYLRPLSMVFKQKFDSISEARKMELRLKKFKSKSIIQMIIADGIIKTIIVGP